MVDTSNLVDSETADAVKDAVNMLASGRGKRFDGETWKAYCVGDNVVRVDFKINKEK